MKCKIIMEEYQRKHIEHNLMKMVFKIAMLFYKTRLSFWLQKSAELQRLWLIEKVKSIYATSTTSCVLLATKYLSRHERLDTLSAFFMLVCWLILLRKLGIIAAVRRLVTRDCCSLYITVIEATVALSNFETCDGMRPDRSLDTLDTVSEARSSGEGFSFHICSSKKINLEKFWNIISTDWPVKLSSSTGQQSRNNPRLHSPLSVSWSPPLVLPSTDTVSSSGAGRPGAGAGPLSALAPTFRISIIPLVASYRLGNLQLQ